MPPRCSLFAPVSVGVAGLTCLLPAGHAGPHAAELVWLGDPRETWMVVEPGPNPGRPAPRRPDEDDAPTAKLPPIGETVRRRPPVPPAVRELRGPELLRALADELDRDGLSIEDLDQ
jgi:hypothetical protein